MRCVQAVLPELPGEHGGSGGEVSMAAWLLPVLFLCLVAAPVAVVWWRGRRREQRQPPRWETNERMSSQPSLRGEALVAANAADTTASEHILTTSSKDGTCEGSGLQSEPPLVTRGRLHWSPEAVPLEAGPEITPLLEIQELAARWIDEAGAATWHVCAYLRASELMHACRHAAAACPLADPRRTPSSCS